MGFFDEEDDDMTQTTPKSAAELNDSFEAFDVGPRQTLDQEFQDASEMSQAMPQTAQEETDYQAAIAPTSIAASMPSSVPSQDPAALKKNPNYYEDILNSYSQLKDARSKRQNDMSNLGMLSAADELSSAVARGYGGQRKTDLASYKMLQENADRPVSDLEESMKAGKEAASMEEMRQQADPTSDISQFTRNSVVEAFINRKKDMSEDEKNRIRSQFDGMSALQLEKLPGLKNMVNGIITPYQQAQLDAKNRQLDLYTKSIAQGQQRLGLSADKLDLSKTNVLSSEGQKLGRAIDSMDKTSKNGLGKAAASLMASTELETLIKAKPIDKLDSRDMEEVARIVNTMLTGGGTQAVSSIQALVPQTYKGQIAHFMEKITNKPQSVEAQEFVKNYAKLAQKQKTKSMTDIDAIMKSRLPEFYRFKNEKPDEFGSIVNAKISALNTISNSPTSSQEKVPQLRPYDGSTSQGIMSKQEAKNKSTPSEVKQIDSRTGKTAIYDAATKKFLRWEK